MPGMSAVAFDSVVAAAVAEALSPPSACGRLAKNWLAKKSAVIVNSEASPVDVLAWVWGELASLNGVLRVLITARSDDDALADAVCDGIYHRIQPLPEVLAWAIDGVLNSRDADTKGAATKGGTV